LIGIKIQLRNDIEIWNNKIFVENPLQVKGDGKLSLYRRWYFIKLK
jgi:hypothetical protein